MTTGDRRSMTMSPFFQLTLVKVREYTREPESMFWVFAFPVLMTLALGVAFKGGGTADVRVAVVKEQGSQELAATLDADPRVTATEVDGPAAAALLRDGKVAIVIVPSRPDGAVVYQYDRTRPESTVARFTVDDALQRAAGRRDAFAPRDELTSVPGSRYIDWLVPGLLGMNVLMTGIWGISFSVGMSRAKKLLKRLTSTPMRRAHYLGAQIAGRLIFLPIEAGILIAFASLAFGVPMAGAWWLLAATIVLGAVMGASMSLLLASRAKSFEAVSGLINVATLPMWIFSGIFFSSANFPSVMQPFIQALPLTALIDALRGVMLAGAGVGEVGHELAIMAGWTMACFITALKVFRWQ